MTRPSTLVSLVVTGYPGQRLGDAVEALMRFPRQSHPNVEMIFVGAQDSLLPVCCEALRSLGKTAERFIWRLVSFSHGNS